MSSDRYPERALVAETSLRRLESLNGEVAFLGCYSHREQIRLGSLRCGLSDIHEGRLGLITSIPDAKSKNSRYQRLAAEKTGPKVNRPVVMRELVDYAPSPGACAVGD